MKHPYPEGTKVMFSRKFIHSMLGDKFTSEQMDVFD